MGTRFGLSRRCSHPSEPGWALHRHPPSRQHRVAGIPTRYAERVIQVEPANLALSAGILSGEKHAEAGIPVWQRNGHAAMLDVPHGAVLGRDNAANLFPSYDG